MILKNASEGACLFLISHIARFVLNKMSPCLQEVDITEENWAGKAIELKFTSFQSVSTLSLFIKENVSGDEVCPLPHCSLATFAGIVKGFCHLWISNL